VAVTRLFHFF